MSRPELFAHHNGSLVAVHPGETEFATFNTHGTDGFESTTPLDRQTLILGRCRGCHSDSSIQSVQSRLQWMKLSQRTRAQTGDENDGGPVAWETDVTIARKRRRPEFNLLQKLWQSVPN